MVLENEERYRDKQVMAAVKLEVRQLLWKL